MAFINFLKKYKLYFVIAFLLSWILFFAQYDIFTIVSKRQELNKLEEKISFLEDEIARIEKEREELKTNPAEIEKQSRERYFMKKENEDVFVYDTVAVSK